LETYRSLPVLYPISEEALMAPLEIAKHHFRVGDEEATATALSQAERSYRDFINRYPPGPPTVFAREHLAQALALQLEYDSAITELLSLGDDLVGTPKGVSLLLAAARMAFSDLADTARAVAILDHTAEVYAKADVGKWASTEAARLRGSTTR
jgi:TolA-binding protein